MVKATGHEYINGIPHTYSNWDLYLNWENILNWEFPFELSGSKETSDKIAVFEMKMAYKTVWIFLKWSVVFANLP